MDVAQIAVRPAPLQLRGKVNISQLQGEIEFNTFLFDKPYKDTRSSLQKLLSFRYQNPNQTAFRGFYGPPPILKSPTT